MENVPSGRGEQKKRNGGNLVVLCDLVGGQNGTTWTLLSCQTLGRSGLFDRILNDIDLMYPNKFALLIVV